MTNWSVILRHYDTHHKPRVDQEHAWFASPPSLPDAIIRASMATDARTKRCKHQRRIPKQALETARDALLNEQAMIASARTFEELLGVVTLTISNIHRIGELYAYDTALRIGAHLNLSPEKVYLHAGTRHGAQALHLTNTAFLDMTDLPPELRQRSATEAEDILCIYKDQIRDL